MGLYSYSGPQMLAFVPCVSTQTQVFTSCTVFAMPLTQQAGRVNRTHRFVKDMTFVLRMYVSYLCTHPNCMLSVTVMDS